MSTRIGWSEKKRGKGRGRRTWSEEKSGLEVIPSLSSIVLRWSITLCFGERKEKGVRCVQQMTV